MSQSKKARTRAFSDIETARSFSPNDFLKNSNSIDKTTWSKRKSIAATVISGICLCVLFAVSFVVPLVYCLMTLKNEESTTSTLVSTTIASNMTVLTTTAAATIVSTTTAVTMTASITSYGASTSALTTTAGCFHGDTNITFDDLTAIIAVPNGYQNMNWDNAYAYAPGTTNTSGYYTGVVSFPNIVVNGFGTPMNMSSVNNCPFTLESLSVAAAWYDNLQFNIVGYNSSVVVANDTFTIQVFTLSNLTLSGYSGLDMIIFSTWGGTLNTAVAGNGTHFGIDNIYITFL